MGTHPIFESDFDCLTDCNMIAPEEVAGVEAARKVGDMRVKGATGDYPAVVPASEAMSPWESGKPEEKVALVVSGAVTDQAKDFPTEALRHQQNKPTPSRQVNHSQNNSQRNAQIQQPR